MRPVRLCEARRLKCEIDALMPGFGAGNVIDAPLSAFLGRFKADPLRIEERLAELFPGGGGDESVRDSVLRHYGPAAAELIESLF